MFQLLVAFRLRPNLRGVIIKIIPVLHFHRVSALWQAHIVGTAPGRESVAMNSELLLIFELSDIILPRQPDLDGDAEEDTDDEERDEKGEQDDELADAR